MKIHSKMHKICVTHRSHPLLSVANSKLAVNQKVYIEGKLSTSRFRTENGKHRTTSAIICGELRILDDFAVASSTENTNATQTEPIDENSVEILGHISTAISGDEYRTFTLANAK